MLPLLYNFITRPSSIWSSSTTPASETIQTPAPVPPTITPKPKPIKTWNKIKDLNLSPTIPFAEALEHIKSNIKKKFPTSAKLIESVSIPLIRDIASNSQNLFNKPWPKDTDVVSIDFLQQIEDKLLNKIILCRRRISPITASRTALDTPRRSKLALISTEQDRAHSNAELPHVRNRLKELQLESFDLEHNSSKPRFSMVEVNTLEVLTKDYITRMSGNDAIQLPVCVNDSINMVDYTVEEIPIWMGIRAFGFTPKNNPHAPPILAFPGSKFYPGGIGAGATLVADIDPLGVGFQAYLWGQNRLKQWLERTTQNGKNKAVICGYSLGGAFAIYATVYLASLVLKGFTYNAPGVSFLAARKWERLQNKPQLSNFNHPNDVVPILGQRSVGKCYDIHVNDPNSSNETVTSSQAHLMTLSEHSSLVVKNQKTPFAPVWLQIVVLAPLYFACLAALCVKRIIFGHYRAKPWTYILGPAEWIISSLVRSVIGRPVSVIH